MSATVLDFDAYAVSGLIKSNVLTFLKIAVLSRWCCVGQ